MGSKGNALQALEKLLTVEEVALLLAVPRTWIYRSVRLGNGVPFLRVGRYLRFEESQVRRWIERQRVGTETNA